MTPVSARLRRWSSIHVDAWGGLLAGLLLVVLFGAVWLATWFSSLGAEPVMSGSSGSAQAAAGAGWALAEVAVALVVIGIVLVWNRLPDVIQDIVKNSVFIGVFMLLGAALAPSGPGLFWGAMAGMIGYYAIIKLTDAFDVYWLWNNVEALVLATVGAAYVGVLLPFPFLIVGIVGLTLYDHVFANKSKWMFRMGGGMLRAKLPVVFFALPVLRVPWGTICDAMDGDEDDIQGEVKVAFEEHRGFGIGTADLLLPAAFASAVAVSGDGLLPVLGIVGGVAIAAFRLRWEMINVGGGAGLPALTTGMVGGYALLALPMAVIV